MNETIEKMRATGHASISYLQAKLQISFEEAEKICEGLIYPEITLFPRARAKKIAALHDILVKKIKRRK